MRFSYNLFTSPISVLKDFCEEYIRLAEGIILWDKDYMDMIDEAESKSIVELFLGNNDRFLNEKELKLHFMRLRVKKIDQIINKNYGAQKRQKELTKYLSQHLNEVGTLKFSFDKQKLLTPTEIYANYYCAVKKLAIYKAQIDSRNVKK